jgi:hypothetical protein
VYELGSDGFGASGNSDMDVVGPIAGGWCDGECLCKSLDCTHELHDEDRLRLPCQLRWQLLRLLGRHASDWAIGQSQVRLDVVDYIS